MNVDIPMLLEALGIKRARLRGDEWWAPCPLHNEKKPSWSIADAPGTQRHGSWYCWGCGHAGGPIELASAVIGNTRGGAVRWMREKGILSDEQLKRLGVRMRVVDKSQKSNFTLPFGVVQKPLEQWSTPARRYLEERQIPAWQVDRWRIGYAVQGKLEGRLVFPVCTPAGDTVCYHARSFVGQDAKYLYPTLEDGANFDFMFGCQYWPVRTRSVSTVVVTEGAIDALACERAGAHYIAALGGATAWVKSTGTRKKVLRASYVMALAAWAGVLLVTDTDKAGDAMATELERSLQRWVRVRRVTMPVGQDAAVLPRDQLTRLLTGEPEDCDRKDVPVVS